MPERPPAPKSSRRFWAIRPAAPAPRELLVVLVIDAVILALWLVAFVGDLRMVALVGGLRTVALCPGFFVLAVVLTDLGCLHMEHGWLILRMMLGGFAAFAAGVLVLSFGMVGARPWAWVGVAAATFQVPVIAACIYALIRIRLAKRGTRTHILTPLAAGVPKPARARRGRRVRDRDDPMPGHRVIAWRPERPRFLTVAVSAQLVFIAVYYTTLIVAHGRGALGGIVWFSIPVFLDLGCWNMDRPFLIARIVVGGIVCLITVFGLELSTAETAAWLGWNGVMFGACGHALTAWRKRPIERTAAE